MKENTIKIYATKTISQHLYNDGLNKGNLEFEKKKFLKDTLESLLLEYSNLVKSTENYPKDDIQDIDLEIDFVITNNEE